LTAWTLDWANSLPHNYDAIVGIPRSGLLVATIIALKLGKPLSTPDLAVQGQYWLSDMVTNDTRTISQILLVDDSIASGEALRTALEILRHTKRFNITTASLITTSDTRSLVDLSYTVVPVPYNFEWCLTHQKGNGIAKVAMDLDGLICEDCPPDVDLNEELYVKWIRAARPLFIPRYPVDVIVSNRLERYRTLTEEWLGRNKVHYKRLYLWDVRSKEERGSVARWVEHKVEVLRKEKPDLMYESSREQAEMIYKATGIPILWFQGMIIFQ
jgi:uncharacterized HAD superfamily protein